MRGFLARAGLAWVLSVAVPSPLAGGPAWADEDFDPDVDPEDVEPNEDPDVEPDPEDHAVEPPSEDDAPEPKRDHGTPTAPMEPLSDDPRPTDARTGEAVDDGQERLEPVLPLRGRGERPTVPHIDADLIQVGEGAVGRGAAQIGFGKIGEDHFVMLNLGTVIVSDRWQIAPRLPLRIRVWDEPRYDDDGARVDDDSFVRREDWDEVSDWARVLAFVQYGVVGDPLFFRYGELNGVSMGHGSLVHRYFNTVDIDRYQGGLYGQWDGEIVGVEAMVDNLLDPNLLLARPFTRPFVKQDLPWALRMVKFGLSIGGDFAAPVAMELDEHDQVRIDEDFHPIVRDTSVMGLFSADVEMPVVSNERVDLVPYIDVATVDFEGVGLHAGTFFNVRFSPLAELRSRLEFRAMGPGYEPGYVSPFYEIQRVQYRDHGPKLRWLREQGLDEARNGLYAETEFRLSGLMRYAVTFANAEGPNNADLLMRLQFPELAGLRLNLFFGRLGFGGFDDLFDANDTIFAVSGRYAVADLFFIRFRLANEWRLNTQSEVPGERRFETVTDYDLGVGLLLRL